jgi:hypothetical protein
MSVRSGSQFQHAIIAAVNGQSTIAVVAAVPNQRVYVYRMILVVGAGGSTLTMQDTASSALSGAYPVAAGGSITLDTDINGDPWWVTGTGLGFQINNGTNTVPVGGDVWYSQGP